MASLTAFISILALFLISELKAQQGRGCGYTTCAIPGQVRMNMIQDANGNYLGGCNCACDPALLDVWSPSYCAPPNVVNFDSTTGLGDCSCKPPNYNPPLPNPPIFIAPLPSIPSLPSVPGTPKTVVCNGEGIYTCSCPIDHIGECYIKCVSVPGHTDTCKDTLIECNNDGYPCVVDCMAENACSGSTSIMGPANAALTVNCAGEKSCEGDVQFNGEMGTDLSVSCEGSTSCKDVQFNFGSGASTVACNGYPDACVDAVFNLLSIPGAAAAFSCIGEQCPADIVLNTNTNSIHSNGNNLNPVAPRQVPTNRPTSPPTPSPTQPKLQVCNTAADCACPTGKGSCNIICDGASDSCKSGLIECNSDGYDCVINCLSLSGCADSTIVGPVGATLTVNCIGDKSCEGAKIEAVQCSDLTVDCAGNESCKGGSSVFNFGYGITKILCTGKPDSCKDAVFVLPPNSKGAPGMAYSCTGTHCPANIAPFNNPPIAPIVPIAPIIPISPIMPISPIVINNNINPVQPTNPIMRNSKYCCETRIRMFKPWRGICWDEISEVGCLSSNRCVWDATNCLSDPPVNTFNKVCRFTDDVCTDGTECCSETCKTGFCS